MSLSLAVVFPVVLFLVMLVVQGSMWWYARQVALVAAREGVDAGRLQGPAADAVKNDAAVRQAKDFLDREGSVLGGYSVSTDGSRPELIQVTVVVTPRFLIPGVPTPDFTQHASAPRERFVPRPGGS
ncbi:pilus assembly protein [Kitasatospora sp. NBC_00240]|uniref:TadE/TadG family type IV pilus assembly protein n=1 Tax=Kitasatospora sp. NBC_00240 TaxID=2903567 RepID=UPI002253DAE9|nr:TadE/TadG family type IV pilus assembly protein [Kitasatospora sp. NBC_00240]MCX5209479.1 pilus assembly protein [Kitasatospora sp. NBC_00240]